MLPPSGKRLKRIPSAECPEREAAAKNEERRSEGIRYRQIEPGDGLKFNVLQSNG